MGFNPNANKRTVYVSDDSKCFWDKAEEISGMAVSRLISLLLKQYVQERERIGIDTLPAPVSPRPLSGGLPQRKIYYTGSYSLWADLKTANRWLEKNKNKVIPLSVAISCDKEGKNTVVILYEKITEEEQ